MMIMSFITISTLLFDIFTKTFASLIPWHSGTIHEYCINMSVKMDPIQKIIFERTMKQRGGKMIGAPEVIQFGQNLLHLIKARRVIDIGTFTGSSAVAWALAMPDGSEVLTIDIIPTAYDHVNHDLITARPDIYSKIRRHIGPAVQKLDELLASGEAETWDFIFIDADKINYPQYYEQAVNLLRPGGVILIDNALWGGRVLSKYRITYDRGTAAIHETNLKASNDSRVHNYLINVADGMHVIFKKEY